MKNNVIIPESYQIPIQSEGTLSIIGKTWGKVVFMAVGVLLPNNADLDGFADNLIIFNNINAKCEETETSVVFEYTIDGPGIRNPRKLLKSMRRKLMKAIINAAEAAAPDWWPEDANDRSGDALASLNAEWYEKYIAPYAGRRPQ